MPLRRTRATRFHCAWASCSSTSPTTHSCCHNSRWPMRIWLPCSIGPHSPASIWRNGPRCAITLPRVKERPNVAKAFGDEFALYRDAQARLKRRCSDELVDSLQPRSRGGYRCGDPPFQRRFPVARSVVARRSDCARLRAREFHAGAGWVAYTSAATRAWCCGRVSSRPPARVSISKTWWSAESARPFDGASAGATITEFGARRESDAGTRWTHCRRHGIRERRLARRARQIQ